ncbi:hypothetical protein ACFLQU_00650 [Verrucomicrobiota bacterium]
MKKAIVMFVAGTVLGAAVAFGLFLILVPKVGDLDIVTPAERAGNAGGSASPGLEPPVSGGNVTPADPSTPLGAGRRVQATEPPVSGRPGRQNISFKFDEPHLRRQVKHFTGVTEESFDERIAELDTLKEQAKAGNVDALRTLMAVADAGVCMGEDVVKRIADTGRPEAGEFMLRLARKPEARISAAAIKALPKTLDKKRAVQEIGMLLDEAPGIPHRDELRGACAAALGEIRSAACVPLAARELGRIEGTSDLEYGSQLVALIKAVGDPRAATTLEKYAERLGRKRPKDKLRAKYFNRKIEEVQRVVEELHAPPPP